MSTKRPLGISSLGSKIKRRKSGEYSLTYFQKTLQDCGLNLKNPPEKCLASTESMYIIRSLRKELMEHENYPRNLDNFFTDFENVCNDKRILEHYLFPNVFRDEIDANTLSDSVIKILLNVTFLQDKLIDFIFNKLMDFTDQPDFELWVKMILKSLSGLDSIKNSEMLAIKLIDLLDVTSDSDKSVRLEIISAIPDIIGDQEHDNVTSELCRIMSTNSDLLPSILDCFTYICLSDIQYKFLQKETLNNMLPTNAAYFPNFVKFLLMPDRLSDSEYEETTRGLREKLAWSSLIGSEEDLATSQVLTAAAIRNSMLSTKAVAKAWLNILSSCKVNTDHKPIDIIFFSILYSISDEKEKQVESIMRKQIKMQILKEHLLDEAFKKFKHIFKDNMVNSMSLISLANSLLKCITEPLVQAFASHMYAVMFSELTDCSQIIVAELLKLFLNYKKSVLNTLNILNNIASENLSLLKPQSQQILTLLDRMDDMTLMEIRAVMNLVCQLAFSVENSDIRDDVQIIIRKGLGSSIPSIKIQGILAGINAVKYLTKTRNGENVDLPVSDDDDDDVITLSMTSRLPEASLQEAAEIVKLINHSTKHYSDMIALFYDELYNIIEQTPDINKTFVGWLTKVLTSNWQNNFLVSKVENVTFGDIKISSQLCLNQDSEVDEEWSVNIAGLTLEDNKKIHIEILSPLFQLVRGLHHKKDDGDLSSINALLGCSIIMPIIDLDFIDDMSESAVSSILDCYIHCVNWIRELLNAFATQKDDILTPKILNRVLQLKQLEKTIDTIISRKDMTYKPPSYFSHAVNISNIREQVERKALKSQVVKQKKGRKAEHDDTVLPESSKSQKTKVAAVKNKFRAIHNIHFRPLNLTLIELIRYDLSYDDAVDTKLSFEILSYLLEHLNGSLDKILVSRIKRQTFLNKDSVEIYSRSDAEVQVKIISEILPKVMDHVDFITSFIECHLVDDKIDFNNMYISKIMESCLCLEHIYNLLTIYFRWIEFKSSHVLILRNSLKVFGKVKDNESFSMVNLAKSLQKHGKYCWTLSFAVSLIELMKALQEHSTDGSISPILKNMAHNFLSTQWDECEIGLVYNQGIDTLIKVYLDNNEITDLKDIVSPLVHDVEKLHDKTIFLPTLKSINKTNFILFFRNLGTALYDKIKSHLSSGLSTELVAIWTTAAILLNLMSDIATTLATKSMLSTFFRKSIPILNLFLSKGLPMLKAAFNDHRQPILDVLKDFRATTTYLHSMFSNSKSKFDRALTKKIPAMEMMLMKFDDKTRDLLIANDCLDDLKLSNRNGGRRVTNKSKRNTQADLANDVTVDDCEDDFPDDVSNASSDSNQIGYEGISDII